METRTHATHPDPTHPATAEVASTSGDGRAADFYRQLYHPQLPKWRPVLALVTFVVAGLMVNGIIVGAALIAQTIIDNRSFGEMGFRMTPLVFAGLNLSLAALWPLSMLLEKLFFNGYAGNAKSATRRLPWKRIGRMTLVLLPVFALYSWISLRWLPDQNVVGHSTATFVLMGICLLTTPLQAAGEEVAFRGFLPRVMGSFTANRRVAAVLLTLVPSLLFMLAHGAGDPWLNAYYFVFAVAMTFVTWKTGDVGTAMVLHVLNNVASMMVTLAAGYDLSGLFNRQAGVGGPFMLVAMITIPVLSALALAVGRERRSA